MMAGPVQFNTPPPPLIPNMSIPPPMGPPPTSVSSTTNQQYFHSFHNRGGGHRNFFQPFRPYPRPGPPGAAGLDEFDGKRLRKSVMRKTVDYNAAIIKMLEARVWQRDFRDSRALQPDVLFYPNLEPPSSYVDNAINSVVTRFVKTATNKMRCPIFCMAWTPEGRRLVTGASSGEFTLWNGLTFNFETILQAHDSPVRTMVWSHNDVWMVTGDHAGYVKYWQSNMNNVKMFQAHKEAIRGLSFSPTDQKFVTCSDDGTLRIWDFGRCFEERILRGHGADVKCVHWHPQKALIISGSKDNQQPVKLWDPKSGSSMATLHAHKSTVMDIKWNENGNWLVTASRDHLLKLFDIRNLSQEVQTFRGHKKEASSVAWHPCHEGLFCSGGSDGAILFWHVGTDKEVGGIEQAHDSIVWTLAWHPLGHILCSGSNDHTSKFWTRNRPGDQMRDKYNLNTLPAGLAGAEDVDLDDSGIIPGMGPDDRVEQIDLSPSSTPATIPGLDFEGVEDKSKPFQKKVPYSKPIPRNFVAQWNETVAEDQSGGEEEDSHGPQVDPALAKMLATILEKTTVQGCIPVSELTPQAIIVYGKLLPVEEGDIFSKAIAAGSEALHELILSGSLEELDDVRPYLDDRPEFDYSSDNMEVDHMPDIEYPLPLPSSIFAKKGGPVAQPLRKTRFSDADPVQVPVTTIDPATMGDKDMRNIGGYLPTFPFPTGDQDLRLDPSYAQNQQDEDLRILRDIDLREQMMSKQVDSGASGMMSYSGLADGPFGLPRMGESHLGSQDVDARHLPFNPEQGNWQIPPPQLHQQQHQHHQQQHHQQQSQQWGTSESINSFNARNFVSTSSFQNKSSDYPKRSSDSPSNSYGNGLSGTNTFASNYPNLSLGGLRHNEDAQGSPLDRSQMGMRPPQFSGQQMGMGPMDHRLNMGPRQMGPNGPHMNLRTMDTNQQMSSRPSQMSGGPQMNQRPPMGPGGQQMGPRGPPMGPRGPLIGQRPQLGPGGIPVDHRRPPDSRNLQQNHGTSQNQSSSSDKQMDGRSMHLGQNLPQNVSNQQMGHRGPHLGTQDMQMGQAGSQMRQDQQGSSQMGHRLPHRDLSHSVGSSDSHRELGGHMVPGEAHRESGGGPPSVGSGGLQRDHRGQMMGLGATLGEQRHMMGPGGTHGDTGGLRDQRHLVGPGGTHGDTGGAPQRGHLLGPGGTHCNAGGQQRDQRHILGSGGMHSDMRDLRLAGGLGAPHRDQYHNEPYRDTEGSRGHPHRDTHRDLDGRGAPRERSSESHRESGGSDGLHMGSPSQRDMGVHGGHQVDSGSNSLKSSSPSKQRGPPKGSGMHMGPPGKKMDTNQQYGLDGGDVGDSNQDFDEEEMYPSGGGMGRPPYFRGRGFPRGRGPRMRMRGSRGPMRGGWRGAGSQ